MKNKPTFKKKTTQNFKEMWLLQQVDLGSSSTSPAGRLLSSNQERFHGKG